eukprot:Nitzschia sp. Nitz4//scaffold25_size161228//22937//23992//NITZ4_002417-RA/size161228-processed-gene-0.179-mRNA-1//-1//CDS//3329544547//5668//frame0
MATITTAEEKGKKSAPHRILALYKFIASKQPRDSLPAFKAELEAKCEEYHAKGTLLIAEEGINGTICYPFPPAGAPADSTEDPLLSFLQERLNRMSSEKDVGLRIRISKADFCVFPRMKVKIKKEIVTMHQDTCDPTKQRGTYVGPQRWNELLMDPTCMVVDTRNEYEIHVGTFRNAVNPHLQNFVEFPKWMEDNLKTPKVEKVAMFCTGGIRCEKATNACQNIVPPDVPVYHLEGGILAYLDSMSPEESLFDGDCYVFDQRVAVTYGCAPSTEFTDSCKACRYPLSQVDKDPSKGYVEGLSCPFCVGHLSEKQKERFHSRQRQVEIARERGVEEFFDPKQMRHAKLQRTS